MAQTPDITPEEMERYEAALRIDRALNTPSLASQEIRTLTDRLAEVEAERDEALNQLDSARHSIGVLEKRVAMLLKGEKDE